MTVIAAKKLYILKKTQKKPWHNMAHADMN